MKLNMKTGKDKFRIVTFPKVRHIFVELLRRGRLRNTIHAFVEMDVTKIRDYIRKIKKDTGQSYSLTSYIAFCLGKMGQISLHNQTENPLFCTN